MAKFAQIQSRLSLPQSLRLMDLRRAMAEGGETSKGASRGALAKSLYQALRLAACCEVPSDGNPCFLPLP